VLIATVVVVVTSHSQQNPVGYGQVNRTSHLLQIEIAAPQSDKPSERITRLRRRVQHRAAGGVPPEQSTLRSLQDLDGAQVEEARRRAGIRLDIVDVAQHCRAGTGKCVNRLAADRIILLR
jgi:hypothetical protein